MTRRQADLLLVLACLIWGVSFTIVKRALDDATPFAFVSVRFAAAALAFAPFARLRGRWAPGELAAGLSLGLLLGGGFLCQAVGLVHTTPSRSAFIVAISSILAPVIAALLFRERPRWPLVVALALAITGMYGLTSPGAGGLNRGDLITLVTAVLFGGQIVAITVFSRRYDARRLVWLQVAGTTVLAAIGLPLLEEPRVHATPGLVGALIYCALFPTVIALLLQMAAQRHMSSARASLLFCTESLFAAATSWLVLGERLTLAQWAGGGLILAGMVLAELPPARWPDARADPPHAG